MTWCSDIICNASAHHTDRTCRVSWCSPRICPPHSEIIIKKYIFIFIFKNIYFIFKEMNFADARTHSLSIHVI